MTEQLELGTIICRQCGEIIDTLDTEKVVTYYGECGQDTCNNRTADDE
jgi:hypothetical protein